MSLQLYLWARDECPIIGWFSPTPARKHVAVCCWWVRCIYKNLFYKYNDLQLLWSAHSPPLVFLETVFIKLTSVLEGNPYLLNWFNPSISVVHGLVFVADKCNMISEACRWLLQTPKVSWLHSLSTILARWRTQSSLNVRCVCQDSNY